MRDTFVEYKANGYFKSNFMSANSVGYCLASLYAAAKRGVEINEVTIIKMK